MIFHYREFLPHLSLQVLVLVLCIADWHAHYFISGFVDSLLYYFIQGPTESEDSQPSVAQKHCDSSPHTEEISTPPSLGKYIMYTVLINLQLGLLVTV